MTNRAARRRRQKTAEKRPGVNVLNSGGEITISEAAATVLVMILDQVRFTGSDMKLKAGFAQHELETGLALLHPPEAVPDPVAVAVEVAVEEETA